MSGRNVHYRLPTEFFEEILTTALELIFKTYEGAIGNIYMVFSVWFLCLEPVTRCTTKRGGKRGYLTAVLAGWMCSREMLPVSRKFHVKSSLCLQVSLVSVFIQLPFSYRLP